MLKGYLIILLFTGQTYLKPFSYDPKSTNNDEIIVACSERAEELRDSLAKYYWEKDGNPRAQGWYLEDGTGTFQGYIC